MFLTPDAREEMRRIDAAEQSWRRAVARGERWAPDVMGRIIGWAEAAPWIEPEAILALAESGVSWDSPEGRGIMEAGATEYWQGWRQGREPGELDPMRRRIRRPGQLWDRTRRQPIDVDSKEILPGQGKAVVEDSNNLFVDVGRTALMALNAPLQEIQGAFRSTIDDPLGALTGGLESSAAGENLAETGSAIELQSDLGIAIETAARGERVDVGDGWFVDPDSGVARERLRRERRHGLIGEHVITPGRWLADSVGFQPDTTGFNIVSGLTDMSVAIWGDPVNVPADLIRGARQARRVFTGLGSLGDEAVEAVEATARVADDVPSGVVSRATRAQMELAGRTIPSRVIDPYPVAAADNLPPLYHGTSAPIRDGRPFRFGGRTAENLVGGGFYTTNDADVAISYFRKGRRGAQADPRIYRTEWVGPHAPNILDAEQAAPDAVRSLFRQRIDALSSSSFDYVREDLAEFAARVSDEASSTADLYGAYRRFLRGIEGLTTHDADDLVSIVDEGIEELGFDVLRVQGGIRTGNRLHEAHIFLNPENVRITELRHTAPHSVLPPRSSLRRPSAVEEAGGLPRAVVPDMDPATVSGWLLNGKGRAVVDAITGESDPYRIWTATGRRFDGATARQLAEATDEVDVARILFDRIPRIRADRSFRYRDQVWEQIGRRTGTWGRRAFHDVPIDTIHLDDPDEFLRGIENMLVNARVAPERVSERMADAFQQQHRVGRVAVFEAALDDIAESLVAQGVSEFAANALTTWVRQGRNIMDDTANRLRDLGVADEVVTDLVDRLRRGRAGFDEVAETLVENGMTLPEANRVVTELTQRQRLDRLFNTDGTGQSVAGLPEFQRINSRGETVAVPRAHLTTEMAPDVVHVPNWREIKRLTGVWDRIAPLLSHHTTFHSGLFGREFKPGDARFVWRAMDALTGVWKRSTLLRLAWPVRQVIGDEQASMAAAGSVPSLWRNPIRYLGVLIGDDHLARNLDALAEQPNGFYRATPELQRAMMRNGLVDDVQIRRLGDSVWAPIRKADADIDGGAFVAAWGRELGELAGDELAPLLAAGETIDDITDRLLNGDLSRLREEMARALPESLDTPEGVRRYVESVWDRIRVKTGDDPELIDAIANGYLYRNGTRYFFSEPGSTQPTAGFADVLRARLDSAPDVVKGERTVSEGLRNSAAAEALENFTNRAFHLLGSAPSNRLSRSPAWTYYYFANLADRMPLLTAEAQDAIIAQASKFRIARGWGIPGTDIRLGDELLRRLEDARFDRAGNRVTGTVDVADAELFGRVAAMEGTQQLIGDLASKNQMFDALRVIMPFGNAWSEAMSRYARIVKENPLVVRRPAQGVEAAIQAGWFYEDANGELVFNYPGSGWLMSKLPFGRAAPFPMTGRVQGLTMGLEIMPGFGPVIQLPASYVIPETPRWDGVRSFVMPYGPERDVRQVLMPPWMEKLANGLSQSDNPVAAIFGNILAGDSRESHNAYGASVIDVMRYLASTGEYDLSGPRADSEMARMIEDANDRAVNMWLWRGLVQFFAPSAPRPNPVMQTDDGDTLLVSAMGERLAELYEQDPLNAGARFLDEFGDMAFGLLEGKSDANALYIPRDVEGDRWVRDHADLMDRYPEIAALFAPRGGGPAGISAYMAALEEGRQRPLSDREWLMRAQDALASILYRQARDAAYARAAEAGRETLPEELQDWLAAEQERLMRDYPGYMRTTNTRTDLDATIIALDRALAAESTFRESDAGQALAEYLDYRDAALAEVRRHPTADTLSSQAAEPQRRWLIEQGERLVQEHPDFINLWERVFFREVQEVD